jgi:hypothetical protein
MTAIAPTALRPARRFRPHALASLGSLARRRLALTVRTPRELFVPLLTPVLFAVVIAPALKEALGGPRGGTVDYAAFVAVATMGLLIPLNTMFSGITETESGPPRSNRRLSAQGVACVVLGFRPLPEPQEGALRDRRRRAPSFIAGPEASP